MSNRMSDVEIKKSSKTLSQIKKHCDYESCRDCSFVDSDGVCIFFNKPWQWELEKIEDNL